MSISIKIPFISFKLKNSLSSSFFIFLSLLILFIFIITKGLNNFNFDFNSLYEFRESSISVSPILSFFSVLLTQVFLPYIIFIKYNSKKYFEIIFVFLMYFVFFIYTNQKSFLVLPFFILFLLEYSKFGKNNLVYRITLGISIISFVEIFLFVNYEFPPIFSESTVRRLYFIPNLINNLYIEYFQVNDYYFWSDSKLTMGLIKPPSTDNMSVSVGSEYFYSNTNANAGFIGSGFAQMGIIGVFLYSFVYILAVIIISNKLSNGDNNFVLALLFIQFFNLVTSSDLPSIFFSNGLLFIIIIILFKRKIN